MKDNDDGGILSADQVAQLQERYPTPKTPAERREAARLRKQAQRTRDKEKTETKAAMSQAETVEQFWAESLKLADPVKLTEWKARHEYVEALLGDIRTVLEGRSPDEEFLNDVNDEIRSDIKQHGVAGVTVPLLIGKFWQDDPELLAKLTSGDTPSAVFAKFGFLLAIDDYSLHKWEQFLSAQATETATAQPNSNGFTNKIPTALNRRRSIGESNVI
jgi:hypothetical protein